MRLGSADFAELGSGLLAQGRILRFRAPGGSMFPLIPGGSLLEVIPAPVTELRRGDIVAYRRPGAGLVAHRVLGRRVAGTGKILLITRGDSCWPDNLEEVAPEQVLGRVVAAVWRPGLPALPLDSRAIRALGLALARLAPLPAWIYRLVHKVHSSRFKVQS